VFVHNSTKKSNRNTKIGGKDVRATADIPRSKGQMSRSSRRLTPWPKISYVFGTGRPAGHHLQGAGAYCSSRTTDRTACSLLNSEGNCSRSWN